MSKPLQPVKIGKLGGWGGTLTSLALTLFFVISSPVAFTQNVFVDGVGYDTYVYGDPYDNYSPDVGTVIVNGSGRLDNYGAISTATLNGGTLNNGDNASIGFATISVSGGSGRLYNWGNAHIESVTLDRGDLINEDYARIETVILSQNGIYQNGALYNRDNAHVESVTANGEYVYVGNSNNATIGSLTFSGWRLENYSHIETAILSGEDMRNRGNGHIESATITGGYLENWNNWKERYEDPFINTLNLLGGTVENGARIENMTYVNGIYKGAYRAADTGSIGTLTLASNSASNTGDWGIVENLKFDGDGGGILSITGFADGAFDGIRVTDSVTLANGGVFLDMSDFGAYGSLQEWETVYFEPGGGTLFSVDLFGTSDVDWSDLAYFDLAYGGDTMRLFNGTSWYGTWGITADGLTNNAAIPEPATLAMIGLGLAGLGLARRRRK
ncbi:MAG: PEP-CTERM sorting domain-containing protein [Planctomycetaceae bacterium]|nr:PEP-CTERM sorting domain-containing protein [Planctomycetaceae bacterium]